MSTHGRGGVGQMIYGSVAEHVSRHSSVPVVLVTSKSRLYRSMSVHCASWFHSMARRTQKERSGRPAVWLVGSSGLVLVQVPEAPLDPGLPWQRQSGPEWQRVRDEARQYLEHVARPLRSDGQHVEVRVESGPPPDTIVRVADRVAPCHRRDGDPRSWRALTPAGRECRIGSAPDADRASAARSSSPV